MAVKLLTKPIEPIEMGLMILLKEGHDRLFTLIALATSRDQNQQKSLINGEWPMLFKNHQDSSNNN
jgi:hypothetical protein